MIVIVSGPGGVGKGTVVGRLLELDPHLELSRSWTTRPRRAGEAADAYVFVDRPRFEAAIAAGRFEEWTRFPGNGHYYGTPALAGREGDVVLEIEMDGASQVRSRHPDAVMVMIVAPSRQIQEQRLRGRGDDEASVARRLEVGAEEARIGADLADHVVVNDDVDRAAREVADIIESRRKAARPA